MIDTSSETKHENKQYILFLCCCCCCCCCVRTSATSNGQKKPTFWEPSLSPSSGVWCEWIPGTSSNTNGWVESSVCYVWPVLGGVVHVGLAESSRPNAKSMRYMSHYLQKSAVVEHSTEAEHRIDSTESL